MKPLEFYSKSGYDFTLHLRHGDLAIFIGRKPGRKDHNYELIRIQSHDGRTIMGKEIAAAEYPPSATQWGSAGWTFTSLANAEHQLNQLHSL